MKQNKSLWVALRFLQFCFGFASLMFIIFITIMIIGFTDSPLAERVSIPNAGHTDAGISMNYCPGDCHDYSNQLSFLATEMKWWILVRTSLFFVLSLMILLRAVALLQSILSGKTFYEENIHAFTQMARYGMIMALFSAFNFSYHDQFDSGNTFDWSLDIPFSTLLFALACKVLAEIFKQGKLLSEENQSFV